MPNTLEYADWLTMEACRLLDNSREVSQFFNTKFNSEFTKDFPVGDTVRVPFPAQFDVTTGLGYQPQAIERRHTTVLVDQIKGVHFEWDSAEEALKLTRGRDKIKEEILTPAMKKLAQHIDSACANYAYQHANNIVGVLGTDPTTMTPIQQARQRMVELACPPSGRKGLIIPPSVNTSLVPALSLNMQPADAISKQYKEGAIGRMSGFDWYESMSLATHVSGIVAGAVTVFGGGQSGSSLVISCTAADAFNVGDVYSIGGVYAVNPMTKEVTTYATTKQVTITAVIASATGGAGGDTIQISPALVGPGSPYQNVDTLPLNGAVLTQFVNTAAPTVAHRGKQALAIHSDAFALVGVRMETPKAVELSSQTRDPDSGISVRFIRAWDQDHSRMTNRFDVLYGFGPLYPDNCCVRLQCA